MLSRFFQPLNIYPAAKDVSLLKLFGHFNANNLLGQQLNGNQINIC